MKDPADTLAHAAGKIVIASPLTGQMVKLADVPDQVFASGALGQGVAVIPSVGQVLAPCDGVISATMDSMHAVGISTSDGAELLIHVGLDTVALEGKHFDCKVKTGQKVKKDQLLIEFDMDAIKAAGYELYTPVLVCNSDDFKSVEAIPVSENVRFGDELLMIES